MVSQPGHLGEDPIARLGPKGTASFGSSMLVPGSASRRSR